MKAGKLCKVQVKDNSRGSALLYESLEDVLRAKLSENRWIPAYTTSPGIGQQADLPKFKCISATKPFLVLKEKTDSFGGLYYQCLYADSLGWLIGSRRFTVSETEEPEKQDQGFKEYV